MRILSRCALLSSAFALCSCASLFSDIQIPKTAQSSMQLQAEGFQLFQCSRDKYGYFWRFIAPEVSLYDGQNKIIVKQGADFNFIANDGSRLKAKIVASDRSSRAKLNDVLFEVTPHGTVNGMLSNFHWVKRSDAQGGIPQSTCTAKRRGQAIKVPFSAIYTFYLDNP